MYVIIVHVIYINQKRQRQRKLERWFEESNSRNRMSEASRAQWGKHLN